MKEDRRVRKTKSAIKYAFIQLLKERSLENITVQDIADKADINRGTFYLHYEDKYLLLTDMEDECIEQISKFTQFSEIQGDNVEMIATLFIDKVLRNIIQHVYDNLDFYNTILSLERKSRLEEKISDLIQYNMKHQVSVDNKIEGIPEMYFHIYVSGATISIIRYWVLDSNRISVDELVTHIFKIIYYGPLRIMAEHRYNHMN
ncbi:TetR/AcrR family transcriptional regulator [Staphylococcus warneri]|uniref:TetR/AcrR family transcriptional regulator n=1 Tax=Staphylococcus warneri TaxID=1292 RepID=UPI002929E2CD|nr:TetR/AcrR family transcriptional regulator [Staphylococcus warneri]MDU9352509.1 TetR/AcrR family transcriptional regulator [Staphylococcus warneri]